ncbi:50S ribosomal protein L18e [Candidatus Bathyarchaeota archaeon]|nr:50S ribosomal protein L18e [Desulfobacterales bacterium]NIR86099.1 50S ribosomal protein L18e [Candidatus Bathyarchaeota archaeon]
MRRVRTTNPELINLIRLLRKKSRENEARIWRDLAGRLSHSRRRRTAVNVSRLNRYTQKRETVVVPGKVLGAGKIDHPVSVAAFAFSDQAKFKILKAKGKCLSIPDLVKKNPKGTGVKIIG